ncbi:hypothetical protein AK812_SmicGene45801, partial [Symbiodinium microadriaticum]
DPRKLAALPTIDVAEAEEGASLAAMTASQGPSRSHAADDGTVRSQAAGPRLGAHSAEELRAELEELRRVNNHMANALQAPRRRGNILKREDDTMANITRQREADS